MLPDLTKLSPKSRAEWNVERKRLEDAGLSDSIVDEEMEAFFDRFVMQLQRYVNGSSSFDEAEGKFSTMVEHWLWMERAAGSRTPAREKLYHELAGQAKQIVLSAIERAHEAVKAEQAAAEAAKAKAESSKFSDALNRGLRLLRA